MCSKALITLSLLLSVAVLPVCAQQRADDDSRFGHGKDSIQCLLNMGMTREYVRKKEYKKAYQPWKKAITSCPKSQVSLYTDGVKILHAMLETEPDSLRHAVYLGELMDLYDKILLYKDDWRRFMVVPMEADYLRAVKAYDYFHYGGCSLDLQTAHRYVHEALDCVQNVPFCYLLLTWMELNLEIYRSDATFRDTYIEEYKHALAFIQKGYEAASVKNREMWDRTLVLVNEMFRKSGLDSPEYVHAGELTSYEDLLK